MKTVKLRGRQNKSLIRRFGYILNMFFIFHVLSKFHVKCQFLLVVNKKMSDDESTPTPQISEIGQAIFGIDSLSDIVGIDLGTQNIRVRLLSQAKENSWNDFLVPASIIFDQDKITVGIREASTTKFAKETVFYYPKLFTGEPISDSKEQKEEDGADDVKSPKEYLETFLKFPLEYDDDKIAYVTAQVKDQTMKLYGEDILAILFQQIFESKRTVRTNNPDEKIGAIISIPPNATTRQKTAITNAAKAAGFHEVRLFNTAAIATISSLEKGETELSDDEPNRFFIAEFGFQASFAITEVKKPEEENGKKVIQVTHYKAIPVHLINGDEFTEVLFQTFLEQYKSKNPNSEPSEPQKQQLLLECEDNKKYLSKNSSAYIGQIQVKCSSFEYAADQLATLYDDKANEFFDFGEEEENAIEMSQDSFKDFIGVGGQMNIPMLSQKITGAFDLDEDKLGDKPQDIIIDNIFKVGGYDFKELDLGDKDDTSEPRKQEDIEHVVQEIKNIYEPPKPEEEEKPEEPFAYKNYYDEEYNEQEDENIQKANEERRRIEREKQEEKQKMEELEEEYNDPSSELPIENQPDFIEIIDDENIIFYNMNSYDMSVINFRFPLNTGPFKDHVHITIKNRNSRYEVYLNHLPPGLNEKIIRLEKTGSRFIASITKTEFKDKVQSTIIDSSCIKFMRY